MDDLYDQNKLHTYLPEDFSILNKEKFNPEVWGPHYWFFLHTVALTYPIYPNPTTKRKYYDLITNLPLFIPNERIGNIFSKLLDNYPITPYLDYKDSFVRWMHFIHNRINRILGKEELTLYEALDDYKEKYKPKQIKLSEKLRLKKEYIIGGFTFFIIILIMYLYN